MRSWLARTAFPLAEHSTIRKSTYRASRPAVRTAREWFGLGERATCAIALHGTLCACVAKCHAADRIVGHLVQQRFVLVEDFGERGRNLQCIAKLHLPQRHVAHLHHVRAVGRIATQDKLRQPDSNQHHLVQVGVVALRACRLRREVLIDYERRRLSRAAREHTPRGPRCVTQRHLARLERQVEQQLLTQQLLAADVR
eukprot:4980833-Prymnesium_polylepis.2